MLSYLFGGLGEYVAPRTMSDKELMYLLENGMFARVLKEIKQFPKKFNVNMIYDTGFSPLHLACAGGALELVIELITQGADPVAPAATTRNTPLHFASMNNHKAIVEHLLRSGANPSVPNADGMIPAELTSDVFIRESLIRTNWLSNGYKSSLEHCFLAPHKDVVECVSDNSSPKEGKKAKSCANGSLELETSELNKFEKLRSDNVIASQGNTEEILVASTSNLTSDKSQVNENLLLKSIEKTAADFPSSRLRANEVSAVFLENSELTRNILHAVSCTAEAVVTQRLEHKHRTVLFRCCASKTCSDKDIEKLTTLLKKKPELALCRAVDFGNYGADGWTPLHCAAKSGNIKAMELLLSMDDVTGWECDMLGRLPLHIAATKCNAEVCTILMQAMQGVMSSHANSATPPKLIPSLVGSNAPIDVTGTTPLGSAAREKKGKPPLELRKILYEPGDFSIFPKSPYVTRSGRTPFKKLQSKLRSKSSTSKINQGNVNFDINLLFAHSEAKGWRGEMEDETITLCPITIDKAEHQIPYSFFAVLDGHGGNFASRFVKDYLSHFVAMNMYQLYTGDIDCLDINSIQAMLERSFIEADSSLEAEPRMSVSSEAVSEGRKFVTVDNCGCTACACLIGPTSIITANIGDSRAVLGQLSGTDIISCDLSRDHKPGSDSEKNRIVRAGCSVKLVSSKDNSFEIISPLDMQPLRVSRAFGDFRFKWAAETDTTEGSDLPTDNAIDGFRRLTPAVQAVSCLPEITVEQRSERDMFLIIACDGVWDVLTSQECVEFVYNALIEEVALGNSLVESTVSKVSDSLVQECLDRGSTDNISVVLITFSSLDQGFVSSPSSVNYKDLAEISKVLYEGDKSSEDLSMNSAEGVNMLDVTQEFAGMSTNMRTTPPVQCTKLF